MASARTVALASAEVQAAVEVDVLVQVTLAPGDAKTLSFSVNVIAAGFLLVAGMMFATVCVPFVPPIVTTDPIAIDEALVRYTFFKVPVPVAATVVERLSMTVLC